MATRTTTDPGIIGREVRVFRIGQASVASLALALLSLALLTGCASLLPGRTGSSNPEAEREKRQVRQAGKQPAPPPPGKLWANGTIEVLDNGLDDRVTSLSERSPKFRSAMDSLAATDFRIVLAQPQQIRGLMPGLEYYRAEHLGEVLPIRDSTRAIVGAIVTVDVARLKAMHRQGTLPAAALEDDIDRILIHEVYGHVIPLSASRRISGGCPDPKPGEPALNSCAIRRENAIRAELGMEARTTYDIRGLAIGRYLYEKKRRARQVGAN